MDKLVVFVNGLCYSGKTSLIRKLEKELPSDYTVDSLDIVCDRVYVTYKALKKKLDTIFETTATNIFIVETHAGYVFDFMTEQQNFAVLYINLKLDWKDWSRNAKPINVPDMRVDKLSSLKVFIDRCLADKNYYEGVVDTYELVASRGRYKLHSPKNIDDCSEMIVEFINENIEKTMTQRIAKLSAFEQKYLDQNIRVFQYQSFDYGNGVVNTGMSDSKFKWDKVLNMSREQMAYRSVLDIGCNIGEIANLAALKWANVCGIEPPGPYIEGAKFLQKNFRKREISFIEDDFMRHDFGDKKFDYVFALAVLYLFHQVGKYSVDEVTAKVRSVTKKVFIGELTNYEAKATKEVVLNSLKKHFDRVEFIGDSMRTSTAIRKPWADRSKDYSDSRQVWKCYVEE